MHWETRGILACIAIYIALGLALLVVRGPVQIGEFGFFKEAAR